MRTLPVLVEVTAPVLDALNADAGDALARQRIEEELAELAAQFGVAVRPEVEFASTAQPMRGQPLRVHVDGRLCLVPARCGAEALAYATGSPQHRPALTSADLLNDLGQHLGAAAEPALLQPTHLHETLAAVSRAAMSARPDVLVAEHDPLAVLLRSGLSLVGNDLEALRAEVQSGAAEILLDRLAGTEFVLHFEPEYLEEITAHRDTAELFSFLRDGMLVELGLLLPPTHVRLDYTLGRRQFAFQVNAIRTIPQTGLDLTSIYVNETPERLKLLDVSAVPSVNPATGQPGSIAAAADRTMVESAGLTVWDDFGYYILVMAAFSRTHAHMLMSPALVRMAMRALGSAFPAVTSCFDDTDVAGVVGPLLRSLLAEQISTRNLRHILQLVRRHAVAPELAFGDDLATFVRRGLSDQIGHSASRGTDTLVVYLLDSDFEDELAGHAERAESVPVELAEEVRNAFYDEIAHLPATAVLPNLLTTDTCRAGVRDILRPEYPTVRVLGYQDIPSHYMIQPVARISR